MKKGIRGVWRQLKEYKASLNWLIALGLISAATNGTVPYVTGRFFDSLIKLSSGTTVPSSVLPGFSLWAVLLAVWAVIQIVAGTVDTTKDRIRRRIETDLNFKIQVEGFVHMFKLPMSYHKNAHTNGDLHKISMASWRVPAILARFSEFGPQLLSIMIGLALAASINAILAAVMLAGVFVYVIVLVRMLKPIANVDSEAHRLWNVSWDDSAASVQQIESVKHSVGEEYESDKARGTLMGKAMALWMRVEKNWSDIDMSQRVIVFVMQLIIFVVSVGFVSSGKITVGELIALNGYSMMFFGPFASLGYSWQNIRNGITSAAFLEDIFEVKEELYKPSGAVSLGNAKGRISFKGVRFAYGPGQPEVLKGINLEVHPGQSVALVGESGVGKSTSIQLISGYYFPTEGSVEVDGIDTRKLDLSDLRRHIAVVPQEVALFNDSIFANIRYGTFNASKEEVMKVAHEAHLMDFISALPQGYDTLVGERGIKLSVGQKQRVAIARAMLRNPAILILDEPTSALDAETERIITGSLERLMKGRTTFIIAHRLSTVRKADLILVFQKGQIVEKGTHAELLTKEGGVYRKLYEYQIGLH